MGSQPSVRSEKPPTTAPPVPPKGLAALGRWLARRRLLVLLVTAAALVVAVPFGSDVESRLSEGGITVPASESARADELLNTRFESGSPHLVFIAASETGVDSPEVRKEAVALTELLAGERGVVQAASYWTLAEAPALRSKDGRTGLVMVRLAGDEDEIRKTAARIVPDVVGERGPLKVTATGVTAVRMEIEKRSEEDLNKAELLTGPLVLIILLLVFGSVVAASTPLAVGILAVIGSFVVLRLLDMVVQVSVFSVNITTALGLGLAIDYSLFIVTRYREELAHGRTVHAAIGESVRTAGRTVLFSALTVGPSPCRPCSSSPCTTCGPSPTRASPSWSSPRSAPSSCCPRCWPSSATASTPSTSGGSSAATPGQPRPVPTPRGSGTDWPWP
ncbi:Integral membrane protein OS=Streptomyces glaucescens OX=1907 GN=SGLAU_31485 PE=4 SV=1 [Streptomyces glaucescens]